MGFEPGRYRCEVVEQGWKESKEKKLPMLVFEVVPRALIVQGHEGPEEEVVNPENWTRRIHLVVNGDDENSMDYAMKKLRHAGFEGTSFAQLNLVGAEVECFCEPPKKGGKYDNWDLALPPKDPSAPPDKLDASAARKFDALFGKRLKASPAQNLEHQPDPQREPVGAPFGGSAPPPDDEVPF